METIKDRSKLERDIQLERSNLQDSGPTQPHHKQISSNFSSLAKEIRLQKSFKIRTHAISEHKLINYYQTRSGSLVIDSRKENTKFKHQQMNIELHIELSLTYFFIFFIYIFLVGKKHCINQRYRWYPTITSRQREQSYKKKNYCYWIVTSIFPILCSKLCSIILLPSSFLSQNNLDIPTYYSMRFTRPLFAPNHQKEIS